jgi:hypothetical protein
MDCRIHATAYRLATTFCRTRRRFAATCDGPSQVATARRTCTMARRSLRQPVVRRRRLVASCGSSSYVYDVPSQVAAARRTCTMARRSLRQPVVRVRCPVASCGSSSYVYDVSSQVATARRTSTMSRRKLRRLVVRRRRLVASCGSPSYVDDGPSQFAAARRTCTMARRKLRQPVVHGRWSVASCGSPSYVDDGRSQVSASTQTQTLSAWLFLYRTVLEREVNPLTKTSPLPRHTLWDRAPRRGTGIKPGASAPGWSPHPIPKSRRDAGSSTKKTTMIYTHVLNRDGRGVKSLVDLL